jgi:hypothetical protein
VGKGFDGSAACFLILLGMAAGAVAYL